MTWHTKPLLDSDGRSVDLSSLKFRERIRHASEAVNTSDTMPPISAHLYKKLFFTGKNLVWILIYLAIFNWSKLGLPDIFAATNLRNFIVYNVLFCTVWGLQGPSVAFLPRVTPGALTSPLLPGVVSLVQKVPGKRSISSIATYLVYVAALTCAMIFPISDQVLQVVCACSAAALVFDIGLMGFTIADSVVMMFCLLFRDWVPGCQMVLLMMWVGNGLGKATPSFKWVISGIFKHSLMASCLPHKMWKMIFLEGPDEAGVMWPSKFSFLLAWAGALLEIVFPICCMFPSETLVICPYLSLKLIGVYSMVAYHLFICATDNGLLWQWNFKAIVLTIFLFGYNDWSFPADPFQATFVMLMCIGPSLLGGCFRLFIPTFLGHFEGTWNHRDGILAVKKGALSKVKKVKAYLNPLYPSFLPEDCGGPPSTPEHTHNLLARLGGAWNAGNNHCLPTWRGLIPVLEKWFSEQDFSPDDFAFIPALVFNNAALGGEYRMGWPWFRQCYNDALVDVCGFEPGDFYIMQTEPVHLMPPYVVQYRIFDVTQGPLKADVSVTIPYERLEVKNSCDIYLEPEWVNSEKSIRGTFLSTYY